MTFGWDRGPVHHSVRQKVRIRGELLTLTNQQIIITRQTDWNNVVRKSENQQQLQIRLFLIALFLPHSFLSFH